MNLRPLSLLGLVLVTACVHPLPPSQPLARPMAYEGFFETFPSGMRLVVYEEPAATRATVNVSYRIGASDEPKGKEGLAHLAEHLAFRGRPGGPGAPTLGSRLAATGAAVNAFTTHDQTDFWSHAPVIQLHSVLRLEAQRMRDALAHVTEAEFLAERDVVLAELRQRQESNDVGAQQGLLLEAALPKGHPYARSVGGTVESVRALTLADVRAWVQTNYRPARAVVVVTGPVKSKAVAGMTAASFGGLALGTKGTPVQRTPPAFPEQVKGELRVKQAAVAHPRLWMTWTVPGRYSGTTPQALATAQLLEGLVGYKLSELRDDDRVLSSDVFASVLDGVTLIVASVELRSREDAEEAAEQVKEAAAFFKDWSRSVDAQRYYVSSRMLTDAFLEIEQLSTPEIAQYLRSTGRPDYVAGWPLQIRLALGRSLKPYTTKYLTEERAQSLLVVPDARGPALAGAAAARGSGTVGEAHAEDEELLPTGELDVRKVAQPPGLDRVTRFTLSNGLKVVVTRRGLVPLVDARLVISTRLADARGRNAALPALALYSSWASAGRAHAGAVGATPLEGTSEDYVLYGGSASHGNLPHLVDEMRQWVKNLEPDRESFHKLRDGFADSLESSAGKPEYRAATAFAARLFPAHSLGAMPTPEEVRSLAYRDAGIWLRSEIRPSRATLYVTGDVDDRGPALQAELEALLGGWKETPGATKPAALDAPAVPSRRTVVLVDQPGASQAGLTIGLRGPKLSTDQEASAEALSWDLERRLTRALRERQGLTYSVSVQAQPYATTSALTVRTRVDRAAAAQGLSLVLSTFAGLREAGIPEQAATRARWQVASDYDLRFETVAAASAQLTRLAAAQLPADHWERYPDAIARIDAGALKGLAGAFNVGSEVVVVLGDAKTLKPQLEAAGFQVELLPAAPAKTAAR